MWKTLIRVWLKLDQQCRKSGKTLSAVLCLAFCGNTKNVNWRRLKKNTREADAIGKEAQKRPSTR